MERENNKVSWLILLGVFLYMLLLNYYMPMHRDDFEYALIWNTDVRIASFTDVFRSLYIHYMEHGGRMADYFVNDTLAWWGKPIFNVWNAFLYTYLMVVMYWHAKREITFNFNPYILSLIVVFSWFGLPDWALTNVWMNGSCVYLLSACLIFTMLLPYHMHWVGRPMLCGCPMLAILMLFVGWFAAWSIENTAAVMNLLMLLACIKAYKQKNLMTWMVTGFVGAAIGWSMLVLAPGNFVRSATLKSGFGVQIGNQLAAGGQVFLGLLPAVVFAMFCWRVLRIDYAKQKGIYREDTSIEYGIGMDNVLKIIVAAVMLVSTLTGGFVAQAATHFTVFVILKPLGLFKGAHMLTQLKNTMSGLEEVVIYILVVTQIFKYACMRLGLKAEDIKDYALQTTKKDIIRYYPNLDFALLLLKMAILNNLIMMASPVFPARAGYGSAIFLIIAAVSFAHNKVVYNLIFTNKAHKKFLTAALVLLMVPMAMLTAYRYSVLHHEDVARMQLIEQAYQNGVKSVTVPRLSVGTSVLRHVFFAELDNAVSRNGLMRYYRLEELIVK